jgi:hypothetical protein
LPRPRLKLATLALAAGVALGGCGIADPYATTHPSPSATTPSSSTSTSTSTDADPAPERGGTIPPGDQAAQDRVARSAAQPTPQAALELYAQLYMNWTPHTVESVQQHLAAISLAQARAQALQAAASYGRDATLRQSAVANSGHVVAIAHSLAPSGQWVLVTSEQTTGQGDYTGLPPALHVTYAQVTHTSLGWVVSEWAPQN